MRFFKTSSVATGLFASGTFAACNTACKAYPGTPSWPSADSWSRFNDTVEGRLIRPLPPAATCHQGQPNYDPEACKTLQQDWKTYQWHAENEVSVMWDNWANFTCLPDPEKPCSGDAYPAYVVNATKSEDVKAGVDFGKCAELLVSNAPNTRVARENNIRIVVKASGHDFQGRSIAPGALSIWMHHMNDVEYHKGQFKLTNSDTIIEGDAITCGGGADMLSLYETTDKHGTVVVGGGAKSVSVGGYLSGGGHGLLSPEFGLAVDNVLEMEVVTPKGEVLVVNEDNHPDLFWALRGGGGSTFGVITSFTLAAHPSPTMQSVTMVAATDPKNPRADEFIAFLAGQVPSLLEEGFRGYGFLFINGTLPVPVPGLSDRWTGLAGAFSMANKKTGAMAELLDRLNATILEKFEGTAFVGSEPVQEYDSFMDYYSVNFDNGTAGGGAVMVSRLIGEEALTGDSDSLVEALKAATGPTGSMNFYPLAGKGVHDAKPRGGSNSVNPGWRKALVHSRKYPSFPIFQGRIH